MLGLLDPYAVGIERCPQPAAMALASVPTMASRVAPVRTISARMPALIAVTTAGPW